VQSATGIGLIGLVPIFARINLLQRRQISPCEWVSHRCGPPIAGLATEYGL